MKPFESIEEMKSWLATIKQSGPLVCYVKWGLHIKAVVCKLYKDWHMEWYPKDTTI